MGAVCMWKSKDYLVGSDVSFHLYMVSRDQAQVTKLAWQVSFPTESSCQSYIDRSLFK